MPMNPNLTSPVSDISRGRVSTERSNKPSLRTRVSNLITRARLWVGRLLSFAFARVLLIFVVGFAAGLAWQSYGGAARKAIAGWSPRLSWLAPAGGGASAERIKAMSLAVSTARQSLDKLSTEISRLEAQADVPRRRATR